MTFRRLIHDNSAASAAEFAIVLPLLMLMLFGLIDGGRWLWSFNRAEKATQMGARMAVVTNPIEPGVTSSYLGVGGLTAGDLIPGSAFGLIRCTSTGCTCATSPCPTLGTADMAAFNAIVTRMRYMMPEIRASNVVVEYSSSGLGYAGNPNGPDLSPLVTVKLGSPATPLRFRPMSLFLFAAFNMPTFTTTLPAEDMAGAQSN